MIFALIIFQGSKIFPLNTNAAGEKTDGADADDFVLVVEEENNASGSSVMGATESEAGQNRYPWDEEGKVKVKIEWMVRKILHSQMLHPDGNLRFTPRCQMEISSCHYQRLIRIRFPHVNIRKSCSELFRPRSSL
jgi:hypothetical protein